jgi:hypothetical protein
VFVEFLNFMPSNFQEPIEQKDLEIGRKFSEENFESAESSLAPEQKEGMPVPEKKVELSSEKQEEKVSEKIEATRQSISAHQAQPAANVASDAQSISGVQEFEKKIEKLVELAVQKGPEHAIQVARHMDKGKDPSAADNYTLDEIHDKMMEDELRGQLMAKGLLKEL